MDTNKLHSPKGEYSNWKDAIEDVYVVINAQTKAVTDVVNRLVKAIEVYEGVSGRLDSFKSDIDSIKRDISVIQSRIKNIDKAD